MKVLQFSVFSIYLIFFAVGCGSSRKMTIHTLPESQKNQSIHVWTKDGECYKAEKYELRSDTLIIYRTGGLFYQPEPLSISNSDIERIVLEKRKFTSLLGWAGILMTLFTVLLVYALYGYSQIDFSH
ncbi:hypothetical protein KAR48_20180 [bacterium]|nr:hypothetical protein [bacterium]